MRIRVHSSDLKPGDIFTLTMYARESGPHYLTLRYDTVNHYIVCDGEGWPKTFYPIRLSPEDVYVNRPDRRLKDIGRWVEMRGGDIPLGAQYLAPWAEPGPDVEDDALTCVERDFTRCPDTTRWVRLPDRRRG